MEDNIKTDKRKITSKINAEKARAIRQEKVITNHEEKDYKRLLELQKKRMKKLEELEKSQKIKQQQQQQYNDTNNSDIDTDSDEEIIYIQPKKKQAPTQVINKPIKKIHMVEPVRDDSNKIEQLQREIEELKKMRYDQPVKNVEPVKEEPKQQERKNDDIDTEYLKKLMKYKIFSGK